MKKILLSIAFALMGIASGFAAKAYSGIITVTQSDGTELNVRMYGDEHFNWLTTEDGVLLVQEGNNYYIAETTSYGTLKATNLLPTMLTNVCLPKSKPSKSKTIPALELMLLNKHQQQKRWAQETTE